MAVSPLYRACLRRQLQSLRNTRHQQRRWHSSKPESDASSKEIPTPNMVSTADVPFWLRLGPLTRAVQAYGRSQRKRPWITQVCTSLTIYCAADLSAQGIGEQDYDAERTWRSIVIGSIISIPNYEWFMWLSRNFNYTSRILSIGTKIVINQAIYTPFYNTYFFGMQSFLAGDNWNEIWERVTKTVPRSMVNSLKLWPAVTAINFGFIPIEYRSIFSGIIAVGWQTYLTWLNRLAEQEKVTIRPSGRIPPSGMNMITAEGMEQRA